MIEPTEEERREADKWTRSRAHIVKTLEQLLDLLGELHAGRVRFTDYDEAVIDEARHTLERLRADTDKKKGEGELNG